MQELNIVSLLTKFSADVVVGAVIACVCALILKIFFKNSTKVYMLCAFVCATAITAVVDYFALEREIVESISCGMTAGALAIILIAFIGKFAFSDEEELKKNLEKLLSGIILSENVEDVVNEVIERLLHDKTVDKTMIKEIIGDLMEDKTDEVTLNALTDLIYDLLRPDKEKKD